ncbi:MAG TPA: hypothetical protein VHB51_00500 [Candidatus Saccharimonadales bacterium]|nr:hypothetical protein [Candidatus Saccharimonadales bacterium]
MKLLHHRRFWLSLGLVCLDGLFFSATDPQHITSFFIIGGFLLLGATLYQLVRLLLVGLSWYGLKLKHRRRLAIWSSGAITLVLALQSIGELTNKDMLVILPLLIMLYGYTIISQTTLRSPGR